MFTEDEAKRLRANHRRFAYEANPEFPYCHTCHEDWLADGCSTLRLLAEWERLRKENERLCSLPVDWKPEAEYRQVAEKMAALESEVERLRKVEEAARRALDPGQSLRNGARGIAMSEETYQALISALSRPTMPEEGK